jgi:hypothetical protein
MVHFADIGDMIAEIEMRAQLAANLVEQETSHRRKANARGIAYAYSNIVKLLREAEIGEDPRGAKRLADCQ